VSFRFLGLRDLQVIHYELEHGCELRYTQAVGRTMAQARALVTPRSRLGVFAPRVPTRAPDYMSGNIRRALEVVASPGRSVVARAPDASDVANGGAVHPSPVRRGFVGGRRGTGLNHVVQNGANGYSPSAVTRVPTAAALDHVVQNARKG
jgi:hypothetical protein